MFRIPSFFIEGGGGGLVRNWEENVKEGCEILAELFEGMGELTEINVYIK